MTTSAQPERLEPTTFLTRTLRYLEDTLSGQGSHPAIEAHRQMHAILTDSYTKRILFAARQAGLFIGIGTPPEGVLRALRLPFEQFYLELDDDLEIAVVNRDYGNYLPTGAQQQADTLLLRALLVTQAAPEAMPGGHGAHHGAHTVFVYRSPTTRGIAFEAASLTCLTCGRGYLPAWMVREEPTAGLTVPEEVQSDDWVEAPDDAPDGALYTAARAAALLGYLIAYLNAKAITIEAQPIPRQQRRWLEARGKQPIPWHIVRLEPRINGQAPPQEVEPVGHHAFRYDVIGHLRFNRHRLATGEYRHTVEWVPAHQRGLDHVEYIPKTYRVKAGKEFHPAVRRHWGVDRQPDPAE